MTCRETKYGLETVFEAVPALFDGETVGVQVVLDHGEAGDNEALAAGFGPLHLQVRGVLEDLDADCFEDVAGGDGTATVCMSLQEGQQLIDALTRAIGKARSLAPLTDAEQIAQAGGRG